MFNVENVYIFFRLLNLCPVGSMLPTVLIIKRTFQQCGNQICISFLITYDCCVDFLCFFFHHSMNIRRHHVRNVFKYRVEFLKCFTYLTNIQSPNSQNHQSPCDEGTIIPFIPIWLDYILVKLLSRNLFTFIVTLRQLWRESLQLIDQYIPNEYNNFETTNKYTSEIFSFTFRTEVMLSF